MYACRNQSVSLLRQWVGKTKRCAPTAAGPALEKNKKNYNDKNKPHALAGIDGVTPYQRFGVNPGRGHD